MQLVRFFFSIIYIKSEHLILIVKPSLTNSLRNDIFSPKRLFLRIYKLILKIQLYFKGILCFNILFYFRMFYQIRLIKYLLFFEGKFIFEHLIFNHLFCIASSIKQICSMRLYNFSKAGVRKKPYSTLVLRYYV